MKGSILLPLSFLNEKSEDSSLLESHLHYLNKFMIKRVFEKYFFL